MSFANSVILYNCKINHNGLFGCDFGGSGATRDSVMGASNALATVKFTYGSCTYMRKDKTITVDENADVLDAAGVNYCRYINTDFSSNHYFYAFVEKIEYVAPQTSRLYIKTDVFMTYFHKIIPNQCFVEREHVADDRFLMETMPESVATGPLIRQQAMAITGSLLENDDTKWIADFNVATDPDQLDLGGYLGAVKVGGVISGTQHYGVDLGNTLRFADYLVTKNATILSISMVPAASMWLNDGENISHKGETFYVYHLRDITSGESGYSSSLSLYVQDGRMTVSGSGAPNMDITIQLGPYIEAFKSRYHNLKLLAYPFTAWEFYTYANGSSIIQPQDCKYGMNSAGGYWLTGRDVLVGGSAPSETFILANSTEYGEFDWMTMQSFSSFPTVCVTMDAFAQFIGRNKNSLQFQKDIAVRDGLRQMNNGILGMFNGATEGNIGQALSGYYQATSAGDNYDAIEARIKDQKMSPDSVVGQASEGGLYNLSREGVWFALCQVNSDYLMAADKFFDRYGYSCQNVKTPQWNSRPNFNYIKTAGANIAGEIPQSDKEEINRLLDTGMTIWHNVGTYGQFNGANNLAPTR